MLCGFTHEHLCNVREQLRFNGLSASAYLAPLRRLLVRRHYHGGARSIKARPARPPHHLQEDEKDASLKGGSQTTVPRTEDRDDRYLLDARGRHFGVRLFLGVPHLSSLDHT